MSDYPAPQISVSGGRAGHYAITHDLELAARVLKEAADEIHFAGGQMDHAHGFALDAAAAAIGEVRPSVLAAQHAVHDSRFAAGGFNAIADELATVSTKLGVVARGYERAEEAAYQGVSRWTHIRRGLRDAVGLSAWSHRMTLALGLTMTPADWMLQLSGRRGLAAAIRPDGPPRTAGLLNGRTGDSLAGLLDSSHTAFGTTYESVLWLLSRGTSWLEAWQNEPVYEGTVPIGKPETRPQPQGVADLVANISDAAGLEHGGVTIDTIKRPDGTVNHIVNIPGTNEGLFGTGPSVRDWNSNFLLTSNKSSDAARMVRDAIDAAGIKPGEPIMLQGHSQGGGVSTYIAAEDLADDYTITHVVTYGSAPGRMPVLKDVEYLNVVTTPDLTPGGDGRAAPDLPNVTNVELDLESAPDPQLVELAATIPGAHSLKAYEAAGKAVDESHELSLKAWREGAGDFLGDGQVSRQQFKPVFEAPQSAPAPEPSTPPGEPFGPPVPPARPDAGAELREALTADRDPQWSHLLEPDKNPAPSVLDLMEFSRGGASLPHP